MLFVLALTIPVYKRGDRPKSHIFFGDIQRYSDDEWREKWNSKDVSKEISEELIGEIRVLADRTHNKIQRSLEASTCFMLALPFFVVSVLLATLDGCVSSGSQCPNQTWTQSNQISIGVMFGLFTCAFLFNNPRGTSFTHFYHDRRAVDHKKFNSGRFVAYPLFVTTLVLAGNKNFILFGNKWLWGFIAMALGAMSLLPYVEGPSSMRNYYLLIIVILLCVVDLMSIGFNEPLAGLIAGYVGVAAIPIRNFENLFKRIFPALGNPQSFK